MWISKEVQGPLESGPGNRNIKWVGGQKPEGASVGEVSGGWGIVNNQLFWTTCGQNHPGNHGCRVLKLSSFFVAVYF